MRLRSLTSEYDIDDEQRIFTGLDEAGRIWVGGIVEGEVCWQEFPCPTPENTKWIGGQAASPFYVPPR